MADERVHVIRVETKTCTISLVTKPTTTPVEWFENDARLKYPDGTLKPPRSYSPLGFALIEAMADDQGVTIDDVIETREAQHQNAQGVTQ